CRWIQSRSCGFTYGVVEVNLIARQKLLEVERKSNLLNKRAVKSIRSEDGDIIDCIEVHKQPAFDHPALRNHTIQMTPSYNPQTERTTTAMETSTKGGGGSSVTVTSQLWQRSGSCPEGTIPIRRIRKKELLKASSVKEYGRKKPSQKFNHLDEDIDSYLQLENHSLAILLTEGYSYSGAKGDIKVWNPFVETDDEYSTSRVSLKNGPYMSYEAIESGWAVNPGVYGDRSTRLFVYWTTDSSKTTGCFDLTCPGFVQTSNEVALGAAIYPISTSTGLPYQITTYIFQDPNTSNWWVQFGEKTNIGYWPPDLFTLLRYHAITVQWGGEVCSSKTGIHPHTATGMGSGNFPDYMFGNSGYVKRMRVRQTILDLRFPEWVDTYTDEYKCYDAFYLGDYVEDPEFYYGGPGAGNISYDISRSHQL
ncbi:protein neprosin-like, partial [Rhododendron vialii]|uniref:protein neprosin-like n=1 Tax=Rhododendron vialii TaxID=182163 RepID=UPI00265F9132